MVSYARLALFALVQTKSQKKIALVAAVQLQTKTLDANKKKRLNRNKKLF